MNRYSLFATTCTATLIGLFLGTASQAADWPQFRHDAHRSAASSEGLPQVLHLRWVLELPNPRPAFPNEVRLRFDASYEPVVLGKTMFVPSMVTDSITALDTDTGAVQWTFFADGPVRFAPVAWQGKVYAVSDDGFLYCLNARDGKLLWKYRGLPADRKDRKLLGNGRLISLWPARGGPVLVDGVVYFAAGIWPEDGVFMHALDAASGQVVWSNTSSNRIPKANMDHGVGQYAGLTPQGYLAMVADKLVVPCGTQLAAFLDPKTGVLGDYTMGWGGRVGLPKGSWFVAGAGKLLSHSGDLYDVTRPNDEKFRNPRGRGDFKNKLYPGGFTRLQIDPKNQRALGAFRQPVMTPEAMYYNDGASIVADDLTKISLKERSKLKPTKPREKDRYPDKWKAAIGRLWSLPSKMAVQIKAGPRLYAGGDGVVQAVDIPAAGQQPKVSWQAKIEGTPQRMLAADGKLFVVTRAGRIYAFGEQVRDKVAVQRPAKPTPSSDDEWTKRATEVLKVAKVTEGYALVLGIDTGRLVEELVKRSRLNVIAIDPDADKVEQLRRKLHRQGWYGTRATVHVGEPLSYPLPPYLANLIVFEKPSDMVGSRRFAKWLLGPLRPYGGTACLTLDKETRERLSDVLGDTKLPGIVARVDGDFTLLVRQGGLPGAADWSHRGANAANSEASQDRFLKAPLGLLWFNASIRWHRKPGSAVVRVAGGRTFILAEQLHAIDVYTGRHLWKTDLSPSPNPRGEMVAVDDALYVAGGDICSAIDPATGRKDREFKRPVGTSGLWSNLRVWREYLVGSIGKHLVCVRRRTGEVVWRYECGRTRLSTAVGGGKVFCSELINSRRGEKVETAGTKIRALDIGSGELLWQVPGGTEVRFSEDTDLLVCAGGVYRAKDGTRVRDGAASAQLAGEQLITGTPDRFAVYDLASGEKQGDTLQWYRRGCTGLRSSCHLVTTRFKGNAAYVDLASRKITPIWNIRSACYNNLYPADGILNVPNVTGGCECNYTPTSKAFAPLSVISSSSR